MLKKDKSYTAHLGFRDAPEVKQEIIDLETNHNFKRSEILRRCVQLGLPEFKRLYRIS